jgi:hypothetical protein
MAPTLRNVLFLAMSIVCMSRVAAAHDVFLVVDGQEVQLFKTHTLSGNYDRIYVPIGGKVDVYVRDPSTCSANLNAFKDSGGDVFDVSANPATPQVQWKYTFTAKSAGVGSGIVNITIQGVGQGCSESTNNYFFVNVVNPKTAEADFNSRLKSGLSLAKSQLKARLAAFLVVAKALIANLTGDLGDLGQASDGMFEEYNDSLDDMDDLVDSIIMDVQADARMILTDNGYDGPGIQIPKGFRSESCSLWKKFLDTVDLEKGKTAVVLEKEYCKVVDKLRKKNPNFKMSFCANAVAPKIAKGPGIAPVNQQTKNPPPMMIRVTKCEKDPNLGVHFITVKGRADVNAGNTVTVTIDGPLDSGGVPVYTSGAQQVTVDANCKWEIVYQSNNIVAGNGTVRATHATGQANSTFTCP